MDLLTDGADIATMLTGISAVTAAFVWTRGQLRDWRQRRAAIQRRNWGGYIDVGGINTWYVRLAEDPGEPTGRVALDVLRTINGEPDAQLAHGMRLIIEQQGMLSRSPTPEELELLKHLGRERGYGRGGYVVR
jgi:hypothetical protein